MDKRKYRRLECSLPSKVKKIPADEEGGEVIFTIRNLGPEGAFIVGDSQFDQDTLLELDFSLNEEETEQDEELDTIKATAVVRWTREHEGLRGMGLQFLKVSEFGKQKISVYIIRKILEFRQGHS
jgi:c-di-GMP-binding flagellar brake protein YcgR